jgi:hypothetical protein
MSLQINMNAGASVNGGFGIGVMTSAGNPWTVPDTLAQELVNRGVATALSFPAASGSGSLTAQQALAAATYGSRGRTTLVTMGDSRMAHAFGTGFEGHGAIVGAVLTIDSVNVGALAVGMAIYGVGVPQGNNISGAVTISSFGTGTGGVGTYNLSAAVPVNLESVLITGSGVNFWDQYGYLTPLNAMLGQRFNVMANYAVTSSTIQNAIDYQLPLLLQMPTKPNVVWIDDGYNDFNAGRTAANMLPLYSGLLDSILALGVTLLVSLDAPGNLTAANQVQQQIFNSGLAALAHKRDRLFVLDAYSPVVGTTADGTKGNMLTTLAAGDLVHTNSDGALYEALAMAPIVDKLFPAPHVPSGVVSSVSQMIFNPRVDGNNASGSNNWTAGAGVTGNGPSQWNAACTGTATAVISKVARRSSALLKNPYGSGDVLHIAFTGGATFDKCNIFPGTTAARPVFLDSWAAGKTVKIGTRLRPTILTGLQYVATSATGALSAGADPTAGWSQIIGATFTDGSVTLEVVPSIDVGDTVYFETEVYFGTLVGAGGGAYVSMGMANAAFGGLGAVWGNCFDAGTGGMPSVLPPYMLFRTPEIVIPPGTAIINPCLILTAAAGAAYPAEVTYGELRKVGA